MKIFTRVKARLKPWQWVVVLWLGGVMAALLLSTLAKGFVFGLKHL